MTKAVNSLQENNFTQLLELYLRRHSTALNANQANEHLDDDQLSAFVEGNLSERESSASIKHLVNCQMCRSVAANLANLAAESEELVAVQTPLPNRLANFWTQIKEKAVTAADFTNTVFAHEEKPADKDQHPTENQDVSEK